jgi:type II secretion system protein G
MKAKKGFTLVEILIVVVILGILAAIVIPQFTSASQEAKLSALKSNLQTIRQQIELYKFRHDDAPPTVADFTSQMATADANGNSYLQAVPRNPFTNDNTVGAWGSGSSWELDEVTVPGRFRAGDSGTTFGQLHTDL